MDLWESSLHFLCSRLILANSSSGGNFLTSDLIALAYKWGIKVKPKQGTIQVFGFRIKSAYYSNQSSIDINSYNGLFIILKKLFLKLEQYLNRLVFFYLFILFEFLTAAELTSVTANYILQNTLSVKV
jgi:hypothetical protein